MGCSGNPSFACSGHNSHPVLRFLTPGAWKIRKFGAGTHGAPVSLDERIPATAPSAHFPDGTSRTHCSSSGTLKLRAPSARSECRPEAIFIGNRDILLLNFGSNTSVRLQHARDLPLCFVLAAPAEQMRTLVCWYLQGNQHSRASWVVQDFVHPQYEMI